MKAKLYITALICAFSILLLNAQTSNQIETLRALEKSARHGDVNAMENLALNLYQIDKNNVLAKATAFAWWEYASDQGSANAAYMMGAFYEGGENPRIAKALAYYELAKSRGMEKADEKIKKINNLTKPISSEIKKDLPAEYADKIYDFSDDELYILAKSGYLEAIEMFCHQKLIFVYALEAKGPDDINNLKSISDNLAIKVIPLLKSAAPFSPECEFMLACVLSDMRCYGKVFNPEEASSFTDLKEAQRLIKSYQKHPIIPIEGRYNLPLALNKNVIDEIQKNILGYNSNIQIEKPKAYSGIMLEFIPTIDEIFSMPLSQMIFYPLGLTFMPKNGEGILETYQFNKAVNLMRNNYKHEIKVEQTDPIYKIHISKDDGTITFGGYKWSGVFTCNKESELSSWMYSMLADSESSSRELLNNILSGLRNEGFSVEERTESTYTRKKYRASKGSYMISLSLDKYDTFCSMHIHVYPINYK